jgi:hypothetical protein
MAVRSFFFGFVFTLPFDWVSPIVTPYFLMPVNFLRQAFASEKKAIEGA